MLSLLPVTVDNQRIKIFQSAVCFLELKEMKHAGEVFFSIDEIKSNQN